MDYCKYHPIEPAIFRCSRCHTNNCDECCRQSSASYHGVCFMCGDEMESLGVSNNVTPFWRRLQESFSYPINFDSLVLIIGLSVLTAISMYLPFRIIVNLLLTSALFKYSFSCLHNSSYGIMKAPDMTDAYGGGFGVALQVFLIVLVNICIVWMTSYFLGDMLASLVTVVLVVGFPAMMINFAMTDNLVEALNPMNMLNMITSIGLPFGLLLAFIMIMMGSVGVISQLIGSDFSIVSLTLQSMVSNYYMIVIFHIMGYMIYQYQDELGFEKIPVQRSDKPQKTHLQKTLTHIDILLKEGELEDALKSYDEIIKSHPEEKQLKTRFFDLILATKSLECINTFSSKYFDFLYNSKREDKIPLSYKRILKVNPKFNPETAEQRYKLASICHKRGDSQSVIRLINGLHKTHPNFGKLSDAYEMMAISLDNLPNMQAQAEKCRKLIRTF